jgi:predicted MFS family arabinose efflux permease
MIFFSFMLIMPILPLYLSEEFGSGKHTIGVVLSGYTIMALLARIFSGYIVDTYNRKTVLLLSYGLFATFFLGYLIGGSLILFAIIRTLHGAPFGTVTVSNSTVAIDVLPAERRAEGIGYYGLSNNLATAISPTVGIYIYEVWGNFQAIFLLSFLMAAAGFLISKTVKHTPPSKIAAGLVPPKKSPFSLDRFFLMKGWSVGLMLAMLSFSYGVLSTYLAIYAKEELGMTQGAAAFFLILSVSLMVSRLTGNKSLRTGRVVHNATVGMCVSVFSYLAFAAIHNYWGFFGCAVILGLGNGHMFPAVQTMFVNLAPNNRRGTANSSMLTSWDVGVGAGVVVGGIASELSGYNAAFWIAAIVNIIGVLFFFAYVRKTYNRNKLR